jgi:hypothetical protein
MAFFDDLGTLTDTCIVGTCNRPIAGANEVMCKAHLAQTQNQRSVVEPALEAKAKAAADREEAALKATYAGPDPDTASPLRIDVPTWDERVQSKPDYVPADPDGPTAELLRYLRGEHGGIKRACAEAMVKGILEGLRAL